MAVDEFNPNLMAFVDRIKSSHEENNSPTILDINSIMRNFYEEYIIDLVQNVNNRIREKFNGGNTIRFDLITNVTIDQNQLNRNFIQIIYNISPDNYHSPFSCPSLLIEAEISGKISFIIFKDNQNTLLSTISNIYKEKENLPRHFVDSMEAFLNYL